MIWFRLEKKNKCFSWFIYDQTQTHVQSRSASYISESDFGVPKGS
jgi:uncharacterized protein (DUF1499 family)